MVRTNPTSEVRACGGEAKLSDIIISPRHLKEVSRFYFRVIELGG